MCAAMRNGGFTFLQNRIIHILALLRTIARCRSRTDAIFHFYTNCTSNMHLQCAQHRNHFISFICYLQDECEKKSLSISVTSFAHSVWSLFRFTSNSICQPDEKTWEHIHSHIAGVIHIASRLHFLHSHEAHFSRGNSQSVSQSHFPINPPSFWLWTSF